MNVLTSSSRTAVEPAFQIIRKRCHVHGRLGLGTEERCLADLILAFELLEKEGLAGFLIIIDDLLPLDELINELFDVELDDVAIAINDAGQLLLEYLNADEGDCDPKPTRFRAWNPTALGDLETAIERKGSDIEKALEKLVDDVLSVNPPSTVEDNTASDPGPLYLVRPDGPSGIPLSSEFIAELDDLFCDLADRPRNTLNEHEATIYDLYRVKSGTEGNGLTWFWEAVDDPPWIYRAFSRVGAPYLVTYIQESDWLLPLVKRCDRKTGKYPISREEERKLNEIEERLFAGYIGFPTKLLEYAKVHGLLDTAGHAGTENGG